MSQFEVGVLNKVRKADRGGYERAAIHAVLDEALVAHVGFIDHDRPVVLPMVYGRSGNTLYLHGAKAARFAKKMAGGIPVCITVTLTDGIVVARSAFHCSMNYRSVVVHGHAEPVTDPEETEKALALITDQLIPGRWAESRPMTAKELGATSVLRVEMEAVSMKSRAGPPIDDEEDYALPIWAGLIPLGVASGAAEPDDRVLPDVQIPNSVKARLE